MLEKELQEQWMLFGELQPTVTLDTGEECKIVDPGVFNVVEGGPDFLEAKLYIDGLLWVGSVEIHLKSSDWNAHGHQNDFQYSNVILHVVLELDERIAVANQYLRHFVFPQTVFLQRLLQRYMHPPSGLKPLPCANIDKSGYSEEMDEEKSSCYRWRLDRKLRQYRLANRKNHQQVFYELLAMSFGSKVNDDCFWLLSRSLPLGFLLRQPEELYEDWLLIMSGLKPQKESKEVAASMKFHDIHPLPAGAWKKKGVRPSSAPEKRISMLAKCLPYIEWKHIEAESAEWLQKMPEFTEQTQMSPFLRENVYINACLPFAWYLDGRPKVYDLIVNRMKSLKKENNRLVRHLQYAGLPLNSAYDSQALIGLYKNKCADKKCLSCALGKALMSA